MLWPLEGAPIPAADHAAGRRRGRNSPSRPPSDCARRWPRRRLLRRPFAVHSARRFPGNGPGNAGQPIRLGGCGPGRAPLPPFRPPWDGAGASVHGRGHSEAAAAVIRMQLAATAAAGSSSGGMQLPAETPGQFALQRVNGGLSRLPGVAATVDLLVHRHIRYAAPVGRLPLLPGPWHHAALGEAG